MKLRTEIGKIHSIHSINHRDHLLFLGSCFAENIYLKCKEFGFHTLSNPLGIAYHPTAILHQIEILTGKKELNPERIIQQKDLYFHLDLHSSLYGRTEEELFKKVKKAKNQFQSFLQNPTTIFISLGTANGYLFTKDQNIVSNCHKLPSSTFTKTTSTVDDVRNTLSEIQNLVGVDKKIILTVSPIRHIKDGMIQNQLSKSILRVAVSEMNQSMQYFPSYEMLVDDLRDYRFYSDDLVHPNKMAIEYIWEQFRHTFFTKESYELGKQVNKIVKRTQHRHLHPDTSDAKSFDHQTKLMIEELKVRHPEIKRFD